MAKEILTNKRPFLHIPLENLLLDAENPRISEKASKATQDNILFTMKKYFDLDKLAKSMEQNGYFEEEPIIVCPESLPSDFIWDDSDIKKNQDALEELIKKNSVKFIVLEGNRRVSTAKILTDSKARIAADAESFPELNEDKKDDLGNLPCVIYKDRGSVGSYLGARHIVGVLKWEAYPKAKYINSLIEGEFATATEKNKNIIIERIAKDFGESVGSIRSSYASYRVVEELEKSDISEILNFNDIKDKFSLVTVALSKTNIRNYIVIEMNSKLDFNKDNILPEDSLERLKNVLTFIYGDKKGKLRVIQESRDIQEKLAPVFGSKEATEALLSGASLEDAYEKSSGDKDLFDRNFAAAIRNLEKALPLITDEMKLDDDVTSKYKKLQTIIENFGKVLR